jgi:hypothetical protein
MVAGKPVTPEELDREVKEVFARRQRDRDARKRQEEIHLQQRLERWRQDLLRGDIWPKCGTGACVRSILAKNITLSCDKCGKWWNF